MKKYNGPILSTNIVTTPTLTIGERFKDARIVHNRHGKQTMDAVIKGVGISKSTISEIESDNRKPSADVTIMLSNYYGVSSDYLLGLSDNTTKDVSAKAVLDFLRGSKGSSNDEAAIKAVMDYTGLSEDSIKLLHDMAIHDTFNRGSSSDIGSGKPIRDLLSDMLNASYVKHWNLATYYIALRRNTRSADRWYTNNDDRKTDECNSINPEFACMKIAREIESALLAMYHVKPMEAGGGYHKTVITDFDTDLDNEEYDE